MYDLAYKRMFSGIFNNKIVFAKVKSMSSIQLIIYKDTFVYKP